MRSLRLDRTFDAVLVHDAICYMRSRDDVVAMARPAHAHLRPGGVALFVPVWMRTRRFALSLLRMWPTSWIPGSTLH